MYVVALMSGQLLARKFNKEAQYEMQRFAASMASDGTVVIMVDDLESLEDLAFTNLDEVDVVETLGV